MRAREVQGFEPVGVRERQRERVLPFGLDRQGGSSPGCVKEPLEGCGKRVVH